MSTRNTFLLLTSLAALLLAVDTGTAQQVMTQQVTLPPGVTLQPGWTVLNPSSAQGPLIVEPPSSQTRPGQIHTDILITIPRGGFPQFKENTVGPPFSGFTYETPASVACIYQMGVGGQSQGCNPNTFTTVLTGGSKAIAIVDAYDYPTAAADLAIFDNQFGLAVPNFTVVYGTGNPSNGCANGAKPPGDGGNGWNVESSLDIEMAHAMAPHAHLYLVEANSNSDTDLYNAEQVATVCVSAAGNGEVSNSWGAGEFSGESTFDQYFQGTNVVYFASAGDSPGVEYPCASPNVICIGGTTISRNQQTGFFESEATWNWGYYGGTGGGPSAFEPRPSYQSGIAAIINSVTSSPGGRGVPDLAAIANPDTGVWIYNSQSEWTSQNGGQGWGAIGGTSVASPVMAGIFNAASFFYSTSFNALNDIYPNMVSGAYLHLVTAINSGACGPAGNSKYGSAEGFDPANIKATTGIPWSFCTGWGSPKDAGNPNWQRVMNLRGR